MHVSNEQTGQSLNPVISKAIEELSMRHITYKQEDDCRVYIEAASPSGFPIIIITNEMETVLYFGSWHEHFSNANDALHLFRQAISGRLRLVVVSRGGIAYRGEIQTLNQSNEWTTRFINGLLIPIPLPRKRTRYYLNHFNLPADVISAACKLYESSPELLTPLSGGHYNAVYRFLYGNKPAILRIGVEDCPVEQTLGMLEWVRFLSDEDVPVSAPLPSTHNQLLETLEIAGTRYTITAFDEAKGTLAEDIPSIEWTDELFFSIGKTTGKLHQTSARYRPYSPELTRPYWYDSVEIQQARKRLAGDPAGEKLSTLIDELRQLPTNDDGFGLIHNDLHFANFLVQPDGRVTIIDFDDCAYGFYAMDIAMALFDVLVLYDAQDETEKQHFARGFISAYLCGYLTEKDFSTLWQCQIPSLLKLKELCIYADLIGHADIDKPDTWVGRFMRNREARIAGNMPYVDIDFTRLALG